MKRNDCTVESLKLLGYVAKKQFGNSWWLKAPEVEECNEKQSKELFEIVVNIVKRGGYVDIRPNNFRYEVNVFVECTRHCFRGVDIVYFLSRPMTEAERLEADLYTGRNKKEIIETNIKI